MEGNGSNRFKHTSEGDTYKFVIEYFNTFSYAQKTELTKQAKGLITHFENFDIRFEACRILDEFENLVLAGILEGAGDNENNAKFFEDSINYTKSLTDEIANSIYQKDAKNILALNYKCIYIIIVSLYVLNDVPSLRSSRLGSLFMISPDCGANDKSTENLLREVARIHYSLGLCLLQLDQRSTIKLESTERPSKGGGFNNASITPLNRGFVAYLSNSTRGIMMDAFGYSFGDVIDALKFDPSSLFDGFKSPDNVLNKIIGNTRLLAETEEKADENIEVEEVLEESGTNQNFENRNEIEAVSSAHSEPETRTNYSGLEIIERHLQSLPINWTISNKAKRRSSVSVLSDSKDREKIMKILDLIASCGGNLEKCVNDYAKHKGLNLELIRNGKNHLMSARVNGVDRFCVSQSSDGEIIILSFGTHYDNLGI